MMFVMLMLTVDVGLATVCAWLRASVMAVVMALVLGAIVLCLWVR